MILRETVIRWHLSCFVQAMSMLMLALVASQESTRLADGSAASCVQKPLLVGSSLLQSFSMHSKRTIVTSDTEGASNQSAIMTNLLSSWYDRAVSAAANLPGIEKGGHALEVVRTTVKKKVADVSERKLNRFTIFIVFSSFFVLLLLCFTLCAHSTRTSAPTEGNATTQGMGASKFHPSMAPRETTVMSGQPSSPFAPSLKAHSPGAWSSPGRVDVRMQFCPELVVPEQCECIIVVPVFAPNGSFNICDTTGRAVLHAMTSGQGASWKLEIHSATGELTCGVQTKLGSLLDPVGANLEFQLLDANAKVYGRVQRLTNQERFVLSTQDGLKIQFWGNFRTHAVNITDEEGFILASTEPCKPDFDSTGIYYRLRVAPRANVGHSLCALLCIGQFLKTR